MSDHAAGIPIVREGLPFVVAAGTPAVAAWVLGWTGVAAAFGAVALFSAWFFRNPRRSAPKSDRAVVAPGDGKIVEICEEDEPRFLKDKSLRISIFLNIFDVHVNRIPCQGTVEQVAYQPGRFLVASRPEATLQNEQNALLIRAVQGTRVLCVQIAGLIARRIVCWVAPGETVACGERYGLIRFGSRMDVFLPVGTKLKVKVGEHVKGGETLLGEL
ncbi:MAG: phosphatidylserine decarboxylase [Nitrospirae bacterium RIFCSPLOWO2_01_FULL_62_17]|nr:MAG: phosphatidylserine decarboxylase [Nitrospirae bacterium RIFCSPLOWO2_01_FULL_62_17]